MCSSHLHMPIICNATCYTMRVEWSIHASWHVEQVWHPRQQATPGRGFKHPDNRAGWPSLRTHMPRSSPSVHLMEGVPLSKEFIKSMQVSCAQVSIGDDWQFWSVGSGHIKEGARQLRYKLHSAFAVTLVLSHTLSNLLLGGASQLPPVKHGKCIGLVCAVLACPVGLKLKPDRHTKMSACFPPPAFEIHLKLAVFLFYLRWVELAIWERLSSMVVAGKLKFQ